MVSTDTSSVATSETSTATYDAIVIGSGFGGLYALHHLRDQIGLSVQPIWSHRMRTPMASAGAFSKSEFVQGTR